jgi:1-aminocyclopropane-1-carboxylate deaminase/D-cysteine desulfhydrase-like pyridoxal-dependent ACC family enzyme
MGPTGDMIKNIAHGRSGQREVQLGWNPFATDRCWSGIAWPTSGVAQRSSEWVALGLPRHRASRQVLVSQSVRLGSDDVSNRVTSRRPPQLTRRAFTASLIASAVGCAPHRHELDGHASSPKQSSAPGRTPPPPAAQAAAAAATATAHSRFPVFERFPVLKHSIARVELATLPTPVQPVPRLGAAIGIPGLYVKRDDLTAESYGGGKVRKLELFLADASSRGCRRVVTSGGAGSNHAVATSIYARRLGLEATLLLLPQAPTRHVRRNLLADYHHGADMRLLGSQAAVRAETRRMLDAGSTGSALCEIAPGGSSPLGNLAYVNAGLELEAQVRAGLLPAPHRLYVAMGTMGCAVGLALGLALTDLPTRLVAVRASNRPTSTRARFAALFDATVGWLRQRDPTFPRLRLDPARITLEGRYLGRGYAQPTQLGRRAMQVARDHGDLGLDLTYTAKAFAAVSASAASANRETVLFWHTHSRTEPSVGAGDHRALPSAFYPYFAGHT